MASIVMAACALVCRFIPETLVGIFSRDPDVLAVGGEYLRIVAFNFIPSGIVFVSSSMFQALGNTLPPLLSSFIRTVCDRDPGARVLAHARLRAPLDLVPGGRLRASCR